MFARIVAGVVAPVLIAAAGYGGYVGMTKVVDRIEADVPPDAAEPIGDFEVSNGLFVLHSPVPLEATAIPAVTVGGVSVTGTMWTSEENVDPFFLLSFVDYTPAGPAWVGDQAAMHESLVRLAANTGGTLSDEVPFAVGADQARRAVVDDGDLLMHVTLVSHGQTVLSIAVLTTRSKAPGSYDDVIASLQWLV